MPSAGPDDPLPDGWEMSWTELVGSPRFEEARQACGCRLEVDPKGLLEGNHLSKLRCNLVRGQGGAKLTNAQMGAGVGRGVGCDVGCCVGLDVGLGVGPGVSRIVE